MIEREIKFRAWDLKTNYWVEGLQLVIHASGRLLTEGLVLMQYTGLKDKNGREIYEGDIVFAEEYWGESGSVYWDERELQWWVKRFSGGREPLRSPFAEGTPFEVIGNVYEHPHLLKNE